MPQAPDPALPRGRLRIVIPCPEVIELRLLIQLLPGEPIRHAGIVGDLVDPGLAEREVLQVLPDLAGGVGGEAGAPQMVLVIEVLRDLLEVLGARPVALARRAKISSLVAMRVPPAKICFEFRPSAATYHGLM